eukprot:scaffold3703_cov56-Phaeocystis_antarctica.AAC.6
MEPPMEKPTPKTGAAGCAAATTTRSTAGRSRHASLQPTLADHGGVVSARAECDSGLLHGRPPTRVIEAGQDEHDALLAAHPSWRQCSAPDEAHRPAVRQPNQLLVRRSGRCCQLLARLPSHAKRQGAEVAIQLDRVCATPALLEDDLHGREHTAHVGAAVHNLHRALADFAVGPQVLRINSHRVFGGISRKQDNLILNSCDFEPHGTMRISGAVRSSFAKHVSSN